MDEEDEQFYYAEDLETFDAELWTVKQASPKAGRP